MIPYFLTIYNKMIGIYRIVSPKGKVYVGQSLDIVKRFNQYRQLKNCKSQTKLYRSLEKYGPSKHIFEVLEECSENLLNQRERYYQDIYNVLIEGLNCKLTTTNSRSGEQSQESNQKRSISMQGKNSRPRPDVSERNKVVHKGKKISKEHRQAISAKLKGLLRSYTGVRGEKLQKPVLQWTADGVTLLGEWESLTQAARSVNRSAGDIHRVLTGRGKTCANYFWTYKSKENPRTGRKIPC